MGFAEDSAGKGRAQRPELSLFRYVVFPRDIEPRCLPTSHAVGEGPSRRNGLTPERLGGALNVGR